MSKLVCVVWALFFSIAAIAQTSATLNRSSILLPFFDTISCRICRSKLKSATNRFSRPTSSRNCRSSRNSLTPTPVYFLFQR